MDPDGQIHLIRNVLGRCKGKTQAHTTFVLKREVFKKNSYVIHMSLSHDPFSQVIRLAFENP